MVFCSFEMAHLRAGEIKRIRYFGEISGLERYELVVLSALSVSKWIDSLTEVRIKISIGDEGIYLNGQVQSWHLKSHVSPNFYLYELVVVPKLSRLKCDAYAMLWNQCDLKEIVDRHCQRIRQKTQWLLTKELVKERQWIRPFQSSWVFCQRLLNQAGINGFLDHRNDQVPWLLSDHIELLGKCFESSLALFEDSTDAGAFSLSSFNLLDRQEPQAFVSPYYDWESRKISGFSKSSSQTDLNVMDCVSPKQEISKAWLAQQQLGFNALGNFAEGAGRGIIFPGDRVKWKGQKFLVTESQWSMDCQILSEAGMWKMEHAFKCVNANNSFKKPLLKDAVKGCADHFFVMPKSGEEFPDLSNNGTYSLRAPSDWRAHQNAYLSNIRTRHWMHASDLKIEFPHPINSDVVLGFGMEQTHFPVILGGLQNQMQFAKTTQKHEKNSVIQDQHGTGIALQNSHNERSLTLRVPEYDLAKNSAQLCLGITEEFEGLNIQVDGQRSNVHLGKSLQLSGLKQETKGAAYWQLVDPQSSTFHFQQTWTVHQFHQQWVVDGAGFDKRLCDESIQTFEQAAQKQTRIRLDHVCQVHGNYRKQQSGRFRKVRYQHLQERYQTKRLTVESRGQRQQHKTSTKHDVFYGHIENRFNFKKYFNRNVNEALCHIDFENVRLGSLQMKIGQFDENVGFKKIKTDRFEVSSEQHIHQGTVTIFV